MATPWSRSTLQCTRAMLFSRETQFWMTAALSGLAVAATLIAFETTTRKHRVGELKRSSASKLINTGEQSSTQSLNPLSTHFDERAGDERFSCRSDKLLDEGKVADRLSSFDDDLIIEQLARNQAFIGPDGLRRVRSAFVIVVGCGGVGSHAAAALARSGISKIRLIDFDQVTLSSLNRHAVATLADVGTPKVLCLLNRLRQITPWIEFDCRNELFQLSSANVLLASWGAQSPAYVIDAIDNITSKIDLLSYCSRHRIPVISSMGAGAKSDPTRVYVGDISLSNEDPLSRSTRRRLRALGIDHGIPSVFSDEKSGPEKAQLLPLPEEEFARGKVDDLGILPDFRARILPVLGTMPAVFGLCAANHVLLELSGYPHEYSAGKSRHKLYEGILGNLQASEERLARFMGADSKGLRMPIALQDIAYLVDEVYKGRSGVSALTTRLTAVRWAWPLSCTNAIIDDQYREHKLVKLTLVNVVVMTKEEAARHECEVLKKYKRPELFYDESIIKTVARRKQEIEADNTTR